MWPLGTADGGVDMGDGVQRCAYCGTELTDGIPVCPHCGRDNSVPVLGGKKRRASSGRKSVKTSPADDYYDDRDQWASRREKRRGAAYFEEARGIENQDYYDGSDSDQAGYAYDSNDGRTQERSDRTYGTYDRNDRSRGRAGSSAGGNIGNRGTASAGSSAGRNTGDRAAAAAGSSTGREAPNSAASAGSGGEMSAEDSGRKPETAAAGGGRNKPEKDPASGSGSRKKRQDSIDPVDPSEAAARTEVRAKKRQDDRKKKAGIVPVLALAIIPIVALCILIPLIVKRLPDPSLGGTLPFMQGPGEKEGIEEQKASSEKDGKQAEDSGLAESVEAAPEKTVITWENAAVEQAVRTLPMPA